MTRERQPAGMQRMSRLWAGCCALVFGCALPGSLAQNESARDFMGDEKLRVIAHELLKRVKSNVTVDWMHRDSARAKIRVLVKGILKKYGYPPDLQDAAVQTVLQQAEALSHIWAATN